MREITTAPVVYTFADVPVGGAFEHSGVEYLKTPEVIVQTGKPAPDDTQPFNSVSLSSGNFDHKTDDQIVAYAPNAAYVLRP